MTDHARRASDATPPPSDRVRVRRLPERGRYDRATVDAILDHAIVGHVGYVVDGQPYVIPTAVWRQGDRLYWHGSSASRMLRATKSGARVCITVTQLDALVLARSAFNHSVDYHSAVVLGEAWELVDEDERLVAMRAFVEKLYPGRWERLRPATRQELKATTILWVDLNEASAKVRDTGAHDEPGDETWPVWAGSIPMTPVVGAFEPDPFVADGIEPPALAEAVFGRPATE